MSTAPSATVSEIEIFRHIARTTDQVVRINVDGLTQEESLIQPSPGGNCLNWVVGHLLCIYQRTLPLLGQKPVMDEGALKPEFATGAEYVKWVEENEKLHRDLMAKGGLLSK